MSSSFTVPQPLSAVFGWENTLDSKRKWNAQRKQLQVTKVDEGKVLVLLNFKCWYSHGLVVTSTRHSQNPKSQKQEHPSSRVSFLFRRSRELPSKVQHVVETPDYLAHTQFVFMITWRTRNSFLWYRRFPRSRLFIDYETYDITLEGIQVFLEKSWFGTRSKYLRKKVLSSSERCFPADILPWCDGCKGSEHPSQIWAPATQHARRCRGVSADTPNCSHGKTRKHH